VMISLTLLSSHGETLAEGGLKERSEVGSRKHYSFSKANTTASSIIYISSVGQITLQHSSAQIQGVAQLNRECVTSRPVKRALTSILSAGWLPAWQG
jgi:hypothetical protein